MLFQILQDGFFAAIAAIGFSSISNPPRRTYLYCAITAAVGHSVRFLLMNNGVFHTHIIPASADLDRALQLPGTKVLMKSGSAIHETVQALERAGLLDRAALVADCGLPTEQVYRDLRELPENLSYFATIIVQGV